MARSLSSAALPDLRFINRKVPIGEIARVLDLKFGSNGNIHCWHPESHQNHDRTASVGIRKKNNTVKCFGFNCGIGPFGPADLVRDVLRLKDIGQAARWIAEHFTIPELPRGKHLVHPKRRIFQLGSESDIGLLIHSGLWAQLSPPARSIAPVLLEFAKRDPGEQSSITEVSYRALARYGGVKSHRAIAGALCELQQIHWFVRVPGTQKPGKGPVKAVSKYFLTPRSDELLELAHAHCASARNDIEAERELRREKKSKRVTLFTK